MKSKIKIYGKTVDNETRCVHYHSKKDVIAIKFRCCNKYYPCYKCHEESEKHEIMLWDSEDFNQKAIICGVCKNEISITEYFESTHCKTCDSEFNENCANHYYLYFDVKNNNISCKK